jgi:hypothetical protein
MQYFSLHFVTTPLHVSGPFVAHHQEAKCIMCGSGPVLLLKQLLVSPLTVALMLLVPRPDISTFAARAKSAASRYIGFCSLGEK